MMDNQDTPTDYLEQSVFPVLLPGMEALLKNATETERRKRFNPLDYLVEYLYKHNPKHDNRESTEFAQIPFVIEEWRTNPRPPLPLSAILTEEEATIKLQAAFRGYKARQREDVQVFLQWQKRFHEEIKAVITIQRYWRAYNYKKTTATTNQQTATNQPPE